MGYRIFLAGNRKGSRAARWDSKVLQVLRRQVRQDRIVDFILAECRLILFEAKPP
ncbi:hypothetical protein ABIF62_001997 [Bradyrhizobium japonicum]